MSLTQHHGFHHSLRLLLLQISGMEQRTISGSGNFLKPERRQPVQRKLHFQRRLCWMRSISAGRALGTCARWRRGSGAGRRLPPVGSGMATAGPEWPLRGRNGTCGTGMAPAGPEILARAGFARVLPPSLGRKQRHRRPRRARSHWRFSPAVRS